MTENQIQIRKTTIEWMVQHKEEFTHAVTLTLKPYRRVQNDRGEIVEHLTHMEAKKTFEFFMKRLNASLFGKAATRFGKSVSVIPVLEGQGTNKLLHYHCAIGNIPKSMSVEVLRATVHAAWLKTPFGNNQIDIKPIETAGWFAYMGKEIGIRIADVLDWENVVIPSAPTSLV